MITLREWFDQHFSAGAELPFSFAYGDAPARELLPRWEQSSKSIENDNTSVHTLTWCDPATSLELDCEATVYHSFPAIEWVLHFRNAGATDTPIIENIQALDTSFVRQGDAEFVLHHSRGSAASKWDFAPLHDTLTGYSSMRLSSVGGRSSNGGDVERRDGAFPFFELAFDGGDIICAVGWSGQWAAQFQRDHDRRLHVQAGMEHTHLRLHPGEEIRSPRILLYFAEGDYHAAGNSLRRFMLQHHMPRINGETAALPIAANTWFIHDYGNGTSEENQVGAIRRFVEHEIPLESYWLDAGWYGVSSWAADVGTWFPKPKLYPRGLKPVADEARKYGMGFVLWFEPERVQPDTWLYENHPEWLISIDEQVARRHEPWAIKVDTLFDLGNPQALRWMTDFLSNVIAEVGVTVYRQDFNMDPLAWWRSADAPDRQGITEIHYIEGLYAMWDELLRRHPGLVIDNCASGGRRIDLETASRSVPLWRTDYAPEPEGQQCHTVGLARYIPCSSTGCESTDPYTFRSALQAGISLSWRLDAPGFDDAQARERLAELKLLRPFLYGDFYALTEHSTESDVWCAYQLHRSDLHEGVLVAFRRQASPYSVAHLKLHGLEPGALYELTDQDTGVTQGLTGQQLAAAGLELCLNAAPSSAILLYRRVAV